MKITIHRLVVAASLVLGGVAVVVPAAQGAVGPARDAHDRSGAMTLSVLGVADAAIDAHSRAGVAPLTLQRTLDAHERVDVGAPASPLGPLAAIDSPRFSWQDAGIGAGATLALVALLGLFVGGMHRRVALP